MHGLTCDRCGANLLVEQDHRYVMEVRITAAWDPPELTNEDLRTDFRAEMRRIVRAVESRPADALEEDVVASRRFDLCPPCRTEILHSPFGGAGQA